MPMTRCPAIASDGRRCCRPIHSHAKKHLLATRFPNRDALTKISLAWGYPPGWARSAVGGALSGGPVDLDRFVSMIEAFCNALLGADDRRGEA